MRKTDISTKHIDEDFNQALLAGLEKIKKDCIDISDCDDCLLRGEDDCMLTNYDLGGRPYVWDLSVLKEKERGCNE